jgi:hypothetical protein
MRRSRISYRRRRYIIISPRGVLPMSDNKLLDLSLQYHIEIMSKILVDKDINIDDVIKEMTVQVEIFKRWVNDPNTEYPDIYATEPGQQ